MTDGRPPSPTRADLSEFLRVVPRGRDNAVTAAELCYRLGICERGTTPNDNHKRIVRNLRQASRETATVVLGDDRGYFVPSSVDDAGQAFGRRANQIGTMADDLRLDREAVERMFCDPVVVQAALW